MQERLTYLRGRPQKGRKESQNERILSSRASRARPSPFRSLRTPATQVRCEKRPERAGGGRKEH